VKPFNEKVCFSLLRNNHSAKAQVWPAYHQLAIFRVISSLLYCRNLRLALVSVRLYSRQCQLQHLIARACPSRRAGHARRSCRWARRLRHCWCPGLCFGRQFVALSGPLPASSAVALLSASDWAAVTASVSPSARCRDRDFLILSFCLSSYAVLLLTENACFHDLSRVYP